MVYGNRPITGREYKLMLRTSLFEERDKGIKDFLGIIESQTKKLDLDFEKNDIEDDKNEKKRKVWYLDTQNFELHKDKFLLRIRKEKDDDYVTDLKCRNSDRYISASYDFSTSIGEPKFEFEEDIIPRINSTNSKSNDFASKFSHSASLHTKQELKLDTFGNLLSVFPGLTLPVRHETDLRKVNNFEAKEISIKLGKINFLEKEISTDDLCLNFWYLSDRASDSRIFI